MSENQQQQSGPSRAMQVANEQVRVIKERLKMKEEEIAYILGDDKTAMKLVVSALMHASDNPKIRECEPNSIVRAVLQAALCGADISAGLGEGYLIPYKNKELRVTECQFQPGYRLGQRAVQETTGMRVFADAVCERDHWVYSQVPLVLEHTPAEGDRGAKLRSYAVAVDDDNRVMFAQIATAGDIEQAKKASRKGRDADSPAWRNWEDRMWRKVAIMRLAKEVRSWKPSEKLDRVLEAEQVSFEPAIRASIGDMPEPRLLPPTTPVEGRGKVGRARQVEAKPEPKPAAAATEKTPPAPAKEEKPDHDPGTGEVEEPSLCAAPECVEQAIEGSVRCEHHAQAAVKF